ncbi:MAG: T9SS type A sorting domain-containing protein [Bacteroidales bacterium]|jgi:hypothetical protein|nr:T9SS type A sorting domain-containing protein [Bacteroidales bacterium]
MKKLLFISFLCLVFTMFTNTVNAQTPGTTSCCLYLVQIDPDQVLLRFDDESFEDAKYNLNPIIPGVNNGKVEYYYFRFFNCANSSTKVSLDWEFYVVNLDGDTVPWDRPLNATPGNMLNYMNVELEWWLPLVNPLVNPLDNLKQFQGSGPLLSGMGNLSKIDPPYVTIDNVKRAVVTDFPGQIDSWGNYGTLQGYFNPYGVQHRWYNYIYADFLEWACNNNYLRLKITRYSSLEVIAHFKVMERLAGIDFQEYYIENQQNTYMGGHGAYLGEELGSFDFVEIDYGSLDDISVCANEIIKIQNPKDPEGDSLVFEYPSDLPSLVIPNPPYIKKINYPKYSGESSCPVDFIDSIVTQLLIWNPRPDAPVKDSTAICGHGSATLTASDPYETGFGFDYTFNWYSDPALTNLIHTGKTFTRHYHHTDQNYYVYVTSTVNGCQSDATQYVVWVNKQVRAEMENEFACPSPTPYEYCPTLTVSNGYDSYSYEWTNANAQGCVELGDCDESHNVSVIVTDDFSGCTATASATITVKEEITLYPRDISIDSDEGTIENSGNCEYNANPEVIDGFPGYEMNCSAYYDDVEFTYTDEIDDHIVDGERICNDKLVYTIERAWVATTKCGVIAKDTSYVYVYDNDAPHSEKTDIHVLTEYGPDCTTVLPENIIDSLKKWYEFYDNCTAYDNIQVRLLTRVSGGHHHHYHIISLGDGDPVITGDNGHYRVEATDGCGNSRLFNITFDSPEPLSVAITPDETAQCNSGDNEFELEAVPANGKPAYSYEWGWIEDCQTCDGGIQTPDDEDIITVKPTTDPDDIYTIEYFRYWVVVTDDNGCQATDTVTITLNPIPDFTYEVTAEYDCEDYVPGTITLSPTTYNYYLEDTDHPVIGNVISDLDGGNYVVIAENEYGCLNPKEIYVLGMDLKFNITLDDDSICEGGHTIARVNISKPESLISPDTITYVWSIKDTHGDPITTPYVTVTAANQEFWVDVTLIRHYGNDVYSCNYIKSKTVIVMESPTFSTTVTPETCYGDEDGTITITVLTGNNAPFEYSFDCGETWQSGNSKNFGRTTGVCVGVIDDLGCTASWKYVNVPGPEYPLNASAYIGENDSILCNGGKATVTIAATGGTPPYFYKGTQFTSTITAQLLADDYELIVTDSKGCVDTAFITVTEPDPITTTISIGAQDSIKCYNGTALVTVVAEGGTPDYSLEIVGMESLLPFTGDTRTVSLQAGSHTFVVHDANGCTDTTVFVVTQPSLLEAEANITDNGITCHGGTATVTVTPTGGTPPYTYWYNDTEFNGTKEVEAGTYTFTVIDENNCDVDVQITVTEPDPLIISAYIGENDSIKCYGGNATVTVEATGGTGDYTFIYNEEEFDGTIALPAGEYEFVVIDENGCTDTIPFIITDDIDTLAVSINNGQPILCYGGSAPLTANVTGGTPTYSYLWSTGATTSQISVTAGTYYVTVLDKNNCLASDTIVVSQPNSELSAIIDVVDTIKCFNEWGSIIVIPSGGTSPYYYKWSTNEETATIQVQGGTYTVEVKDDNECVTSAQIVLTNPTQLQIVISGDAEICNAGDGALTVTPSGGTGEYSYKWSTDETTASIQNLDTGTYYVTVTDENGCFVTGYFTINYYLDLELNIIAEKNCNDPMVRVVVDCNYAGIIDIEMYIYDMGTGNLTLLETYSTDPSITDYVSHDFNSATLSCDVYFLVFIAKIKIEDIDCTFESQQSNIINLKGAPELLVYEFSQTLPNGTSNPSYDPDANEMTVEAGQPINYYFRVVPTECQNPDLRLSVDYEYYLDGSLATPMHNYITKPLSGTFMNFITPMNNCATGGAPVIYNNITEKSYFPYQDNVGWVFRNNSYSFFRDAFLEERQIQVSLSGFDTVGTYTVDFDLVTHLPKSCSGTYGNLISGTMCTSIGAIGGNNFYTIGQSGEPDYIRVVLAKRTMIIHVTVPTTSTQPPIIGSFEILDAVIFPNPAKDDITVRFNTKGESEGKVRIVNLTGSLVLDQPIVISNKDVNIKLPEITPGFYFVSIISNEAVITRKLVIEPK